MKKVITLLSLCAVFLLSSMVLSDSKNYKTLNHEKKIDNGKEFPKPLVEKGKITIKVKKNFGKIISQEGAVEFNSESLDQLSEKFEIQSITQRFRFNPSKMKAGLPDLSRIYKIEFPEKYSPQRVSQAFAKDPNIEYAEPIPINYLCEVPDDPYYNFQHFLPQIQAEEAWDIHKGEDGEEDVIIAIVDTGTDWDHEDLQANAWQNLGEDADGDGVVMEYNGSEWVFDPDDENGIDDDGNGFVDDFTGWNYYYETKDPSPIFGDDAWDHGTHCAGLAAAVTNNGIGVACISWNVNFMSLHTSIPEGYITYGYDGIIYAAENGAHVITNSWGGYQYSQANFEVIQYAAGLGSIIAAAAGNENQYGTHYPSTYPQVISVASINKNDYKASYSNFGPNITVGAPGGEGSANGLYSTIPNDSYNWLAGTSMASPTCAGLLGLVRSYHPEWSNEEVITQVVSTADNIDTLNPNYINELGSGRINAFRALNEEGVTLPQEIKLELISTTIKDQDNNLIFAPGDTLIFDITLQNYSLGGSDPAASFQLSCNDPHIEVLENTYVDTIPFDNYFTLHDAFLAVIGEGTTTIDVDFCLSAASTLPILYGDTLHFQTLVAPDGICIYRGEGTGNAYSGEYINNFLQNNGYEVYYTTSEPHSLRGFDVVFVSLGNLGQSFEYGTIASEEFCEKCALYLQDGGNMYMEGGSLMSLMMYFEYAWYEELKDLFCIADNELSETANDIDTLFGLSGSIAEDLFFTGTNQNPYWYIDILTPDDNGTAILEENDYGVVAVQGEGEYGQKTIINGYAISKLQAGEPGMTQTLMAEVCQYLEIDVGVGMQENVSGSRFQVSGYPNPTSSKYYIDITLDQEECVSIRVYDILGNIIITELDKQLTPGENVVEMNLKELEAGIFFCSVQIGGNIVTKKIVKAD